MNPMQARSSYFFNIRFNTVLPFAPTSGKWSLYFRFLFEHKQTLFLCHVPEIVFKVTAIPKA
jgi:hypothetical protein